MNTIDAIHRRKSVRAFTEKTVPVDVVDEILTIAKEAPTGGNMQPWQVAVVRGKTMEKLAVACIKAAEEMQPPNPDVTYYPEPMPPKYAQRRHVMGIKIYQYRGIEFTEKRVDWPAVLDLNKQNYYFFGADIGLLFFMESSLAEGSLLDMGMFMQNIMLAAQEYGLATCAQASWGNYPEITKEILGIEEELRLICGMSLGYPDESILEPERIRENNRHFVRWYD